MRIHGQAINLWQQLKEQAKGECTCNDLCKIVVAISGAFYFICQG